LVSKSGGHVLRGNKVDDDEGKASERRRTPVVAAEVSGFARSAVESYLLLRHDSPSSSAQILRLGAFVEFANRALGIGVADTNTFADSGLPIEQILGMSYCGVSGLALDEVMLRFCNDRAAITAAFSLRGDSLCGGAERFEGHCLSLCKRIGAAHVDGASPIRRRLLRMHINGAAAWFVSSGVLRELARRCHALAGVVCRFQNRRAAGT